MTINLFDRLAGIEILEKSAAMIDAMPPPPGPPPLIKPVRELFGEILLRAGQPEKAASQFAISLSRHPNRARSLLGAARAAAKSGKAKTPHGSMPDSRSSGNRPKRSCRKCAKRGITLIRQGLVSGNKPQAAEGDSWMQKTER